MHIGGLTDLTQGNGITVLNSTQGSEYTVRHVLSPRQIEILLAEV